MKHFIVEFANGKKYTVHGNTHTEAKKEARRLFPIFEEFEIIGTYLV